jgi:5-methylcytosine-specific restriction endonuclease McrA
VSADQTFSDSSSFAQHLHQLRADRTQRVESGKASRPKRLRLTTAQRAEILLKAGGRCHLCGGPIDGQEWEADHVFAHSTGGAHSLDNYLPAHSLCNNYRWHYDTEELQWILKLGVWLRTQIENQTPIGQQAGTHFLADDRRRAARRKPQPGLG